MRSVYLFFLFTLMLTAQNSRVLNNADFNVMISLYGHDSLNFRLPPTRVVDSLKHRPFVWTRGYRIQVFAGSDFKNILHLKSKLINSVPDSVYIIKEGNLYRLQFGDYEDRIIAETKVDSMRKYGWPEAWIVSGRIRRFTPDSSASPRTSPNTGKTSSGILFAVQLGAFSSLDAANIRLQELLQWNKEVYIKPVGRFYKILAGSFTNRNEAERLLDKAKSNGLSEAWVTSFAE